MKIAKFLLATASLLGCLSMSAQNAEVRTEYDFIPHWYGQAQVGIQESLGEGPFKDLLAPNANLAVGYQFNPLFGLRLGIGSWISKGTELFVPIQNGTAWSAKYPDGRANWKWNYIAPALDVTLDLSHLIYGYNPERLVDVNIFAGIGANIAWKNDEANEINALMSNTIYGTNSGKDCLRLIWNGTKTRFLGRLGAAVDFRLTNNLKAGLEFNANIVPDGYNSKKADNADWYFNLLAGVKYTFGQSYEKRIIDIEPPVREVTRIEYVEVPQVVEAVEAIEEIPAEMTRDVFFTLNSTRISIQEQQKVKEIAEFMKANPGSRVTITGYADRQTGTATYNYRISERRAQAVAKMLIDKYGINADRITTGRMDNISDQPFTEQVLNRVAICVAK